MMLLRTVVMYRDPNQTFLAEMFFGQVLNGSANMDNVKRYEMYIF